MKVIILLAGYGSRMRPLTWSRPKPILSVAGSTVIGHILDEMADVLQGELIFVVGYRGDQIEQWIRTHYAHLNSRFVVQEKPLGQAHAVNLCRPHFAQDDEVVVAFGDGVVGADFGRFHEYAQPSADAVLTVQEVADPRAFGVVQLDEKGYVSRFIEKPSTMENKNAAVGINWFRSSDQLFAAIDTILRENRQTKGEYFMADAYGVMLEQGAQFRVMPVKHWLDAGSPENILETNARLLGMGTGVSADAIERGYGEGFTVVPPVYIHESAEITASVIGPYTHIGAGATIHNAIISNSIIDAHANIENSLLQNSLVGEKARVHGQLSQLFIGDNAQST